MKVLTAAAAGSAEWKEAHKGKLGSNLICDILGVGRQSRLKAWALLTGKVEEEDISGRSYIRRGIALEPVVCDLYSQETGRKLSPTPGLVQHPEVDWIACTPDRMLEEDDGRGLGVLEAKTFGFWRAHDWRAGIPVRVRTQAHAIGMCTGARWLSYAAMPIDDDEDTEPVLWADETLNFQLVDWMMNELVDFREKHWQKDVPPPAEASDLGAIKAIYSHDQPAAITLSPEIVELCLEHEQLGKVISDTKRERDAAEARIRQFMGDHRWASGPGFVMRCQVEPRAAHTVAASEPRVLRKMREMK